MFQFTQASGKLTITEIPLGQRKFLFETDKKVKNYFFLSFKVQALAIIRNGLKINLYIAHSTRFSIVIDIHSFIQPASDIVYISHIYFFSSSVCL
jgi:hypothetical protein